MVKKKSKNKRKKKKKILTFIVFIILLILVSYFWYFYIYKKGVNYKEKITIEVGEVVPSVSDYVSESDLSNVSENITWKDLEIVDNKIYKTGEYNGIITYRDENLEVKLVVKDTKSPVISGVKDLEMLAYESVPSFLDGITVSDNSGRNIEINVQGEYDTENVGEYKLYYIAVDESGNKASEEFSLIVKENKNVKVSKTSKGYTLKKYYGITYIDNIIIANKTYSLPSNFVPNNLVSINGYIKVVDYVKKAFDELKSDANSIGLNIYASSGYRSYSNQNYIYNNYVKLDGQENADTYSARAGHSEHQTGLAIDLNSIDMTFDNTDESNWIKDNCYKYGFIIRYPKDKDNITGYMYEPWHIRYVGKELASKLYNNGEWITIEEYYGIDSKYE